MKTYLIDLATKPTHLHKPKHRDNFQPSWVDSTQTNVVGRLRSNDHKKKDDKKNDKNRKVCFYQFFLIANLFFKPSQTFTRPTIQRQKPTKLTRGKEAWVPDHVKEKIQDVKIDDNADTEATEIRSAVSFLNP